MAPRNLDRELEGLRKQEANKTCMSCGLYSAFGFRDVCVRYAVFCCRRGQLPLARLGAARGGEAALLPRPGEAAALVVGC